MTGPASLPMYDLPELRPYADRLWAALRDRLRQAGVAAPDGLMRPGGLAAHWRDPSLLLSQSCGLPLLSLPDPVRVVATPCYDAPGCSGADYRSAIVVRRDNPATGLAALRGRVCALNGWDSNSGMNLLRASLAPLAGGRAFFAAILETGSHAASLEAVADGRADVAAIDCVTLELLRRYRPAATARLRIIDWTPACPGLPLITAAPTATLEALRRALDAVAADPAVAATRSALLLTGFAVLPDDAYEAVRRLADAARATGYPALA